MNCEICGSKLKPLFTSNYCPNEDKHNLKKEEYFFTKEAFENPLSDGKGWYPNEITYDTYAKVTVEKQKNTNLWKTVEEKVIESAVLSMTAEEDRRFSELVALIIAHSKATFKTCGAKMWNSKPKKITCNCRAKAKNNPKYSGGICYLSGKLRPSVQERIEGKKLVKTYLLSIRDGIEPDDVEET